MDQNFSTPRYSNSRLLQIFPEARPILKKGLKDYASQAEKLRKRIEIALKKLYEKVTDEFSIWFYEQFFEVFLGEGLERTTKKIREIKWTLNPIKREGQITPEIIARAKEYPFENLIKFNRAKKALCMFHDEKHPSLSLNPKTNRIKCFGCGINLDPIGYIMETQNLSFIEAVKYLNN